jgi:hypothetical protein
MTSARNVLLRGSVFDGVDRAFVAVLAGTFSSFFTAATKRNGGSVVLIAIRVFHFYFIYKANQLQLYRYLKRVKQKRTSKRKPNYR